MAELDAHAAVAVAEATVEESIAALEKSQQELQDASAATIAANLQQLTALQQRLEEDRARLAKQQKRTRAGAVPVLNAADIEQQRVLETEVNELRRRRDNARDGNARQSRKLATIFEECERLQHILDTPAGTAFPPKSARAQARLTPSERLEASMSTLGASMRAGPAGSALRAGLHGGNLSARSTTSAHGAAPPQSGAAIADRLAMERQERELHVAEAKLAAAQLKRDTYLHMRDRLTHEKLSFDPRFNAKYAELQRERKRVAKLRIVSTEATQAMANAESVRRATERKVAVKQQKEKDLLAQQQTTLLSTQQSVLHFEVSRMSRSQSAIKLGGLHAASATDAEQSSVWSAPSEVGLGGAYAASAIGADPSLIDEPSAYAGGIPLSKSPSGIMSEADVALANSWERLRRATGVLEPIDLIHKALEQLSARTELEALETHTKARLAELGDEAEGLARRREKSGASATLASNKRLERLHELVSLAEKELARATGALGASDVKVAAARRNVAELDALAQRASASVAASGARSGGYLRLADPLECESASLAGLTQNAVDASACMGLQPGASMGLGPCAPS